MPPFRIAILICDTPLPEVEARFGNYGDMFIKVFLDSAATLNPPMGPQDFHFTTWDVVNSDVYPSMDDIDAFLISGAKHNAFDQIPWINNLTEYTRRALLEQNRVRVIGVCFGHQIVGRALGGVVDRNINGWEIAVTEVKLHDPAKQVFGGRDSFNIHQMHRDHLVTLPVNPFAQLPEAVLEIIGETDKCGVQGLYTRRKVLTVQGHPEFNGTIIRHVCDARRKLGVFTDSMVQDALSRADWPHDGSSKNGVGVAFLRFAMEK